MHSRMRMHSRTAARGFTLVELNHYGRVDVTDSAAFDAA